MSMVKEFRKAKIAIKRLKARTGRAFFFGRTNECPTPLLGLELGTGWAPLAEMFDVVDRVSYDQILLMKSAAVDGHAGELIFATYGEGRSPVLILNGRVHGYEGHSLGDQTFGTRICAMLGVDAFILTNAAGSLIEWLKPGDLGLIEDHINMLGANPLTGTNNSKYGKRFLAQEEPYDLALRTIVQDAAQEVLNMTISDCVYAAMPGPTFETRAEAHMLAMLGAHAVGMSTVPANIMLRHMGKRVLGLSAISNFGANVRRIAIDHDNNANVVADAVREKVVPIMRIALPKILVELEANRAA